MNRQAELLEYKINRVIVRFENAEAKSRGGYKTVDHRPTTIISYTPGRSHRLRPTS